MKKVDFFVHDKSEETVRNKLESIFGKDCGICFGCVGRSVKFARVTQ